MWFLESGFFVQVLAFACAGALIVGGLALGITLAAKGSVTIGF